MIVIYRSISSPVSRFDFPGRLLQAGDIAIQLPRQPQDDRPGRITLPLLVRSNSAGSLHLLRYGASDGKPAVFSPGSYPMPIKVVEGKPELDHWYVRLVKNTSSLDLKESMTP
jgi:hypothetical protein